MARIARRQSGTDIYHGILRGDTTLLWQFGGGYVELNANGTPTSWNYYVTDHLGSTRMVVDSNDSIRETINYYPFGSEMKMENPALLTGDFEQRFRFTGKELVRLNGLNMYDFGARWYDVAGVPMWTSIDPLAEKYYNVSPYAYCANNPVSLVDPDGRDWLLVTENDVCWYGGETSEFSANAVLCGTVSEICGGRFANDAVTGAYSIMSTDMMQKRKTRQQMKRIIESDGILTFEEAYYWYKHGKGTTLTVDASKIDLNFVDISGMKVGDKITVSTWKGGVDQGIVYGSISIEYVGNNAVSISDDKYDFDMHSWSNIGESVRNIETIFADWVHGTGTPFKIHFKGYNKIK